MYKLIGVISCLLLLSVGICVADDEAYIPSDESLLGGFGGGTQVMVCYHPSLSKLNAHLKKEGFDSFNALYGMGGTIRWSFDQNYQIGITGAGFGGVADNINNGTVTEATIGGGYYILQGIYRIPLGQWWAVSVGAGVGRASAGYKLLITDKGTGTVVSLIQAGGSDWIGQVFIDGAYRIKGVFGIGLDVTYTFGKIDEIKRGGEIDGTLPEIDLSGVMIRVGPRFHF
ncbi:MAG: hypothetical protein ABH886_08160 [Candidatus Desantisbacteria bacterium]